MTATQPILVAPLLPSIGWLDVSLPPVALGLSLLLHTVYNLPQLPPEQTHGHLYRARTAHARFLPIQAKHVFSYPVLFFGVDVDALEAGKLELGRLFGYNPSNWRWTAMRSRVYFEPGQELQGIREKLWRHLESRGVRLEQVRKIYTVTMPALVGLQDINPLTIHYTYSLNGAGARKLEVVVLEVSNTFGEKHLYVLRVGEAEDEVPSLGYEHQWTFPRAFHVSPFNDRTGFYRVALSDPLRSSSPPSPHLPANPQLAIKIVTLTSEGEKKLYASLAGPSVPLQPSNLIGALCRYPLSLLLTTPRILYQAMLLHYGRRLDVFPRPDSYVATGEEDEGELSNPVEAGGEDGGVQWQEEGSFEVLARERVVSFLEQRVRQLEQDGARRIQVILRPANKTRSPIEISPSSTVKESLNISYLTPLFFSDILASPSIPLALALGSKTERRWRTSNDELFLELFSSSPPPHSVAPSLPIRLMRRLRLSAFRWSLSFSSSSAPPPSAVSVPPHPLDGPSTSLALVCSLWAHFFYIRLGYWIFRATGARFVRGTEPWEEWSRWAAREQLEESLEAEMGKRQFGSVLRGLEQ